jgi:hypothetical protein
MKTIFTLLLSTIFSLASMAYDGGRLTVTSIGPNRMFVEVDGRRYNLDGNTVSLNNIRPGTHNVRVLREMRRRAGGNFGIGNGREEVIYSIRATFRDSYHFDILINRFGKVMIDERRIDPNEDWYDSDDDYYDNDDRDRDRNNTRDNRDYNDNRNRNNKVYEDNRDNGNDRDYKDNGNSRNDRDSQYEDDNDDNYGRAMNSVDFNQARETIRKEWVENTRVTVTKQVIDRNYFTSQQVKEMLMLFTFENNRLEIAKYAYGKTVDKGNYFIVNDAFTFNNNKEELARYIREFK